MPLEISEDHDSRATRQFKREGRIELNMERRFTIIGTDDTLHDDVETVGPKIGDQYLDKNLYAFDRKIEVLRPTGASGILRLVVQYGPPERLPQNNGNEPEYEFSTMAETLHIEQAKDQVHYPDSADGVANLIGVNGDQIDGCDILIPKPAWKQTREIAILSNTYVRTLTEMTGTVNNAAWKFWQADEVLFLGVTARRRGYGMWRLDFNFGIQPNTDQVIDTSTGVQNFVKPGWDYMWFEKARAASDEQIIHSVRAAHVAEVYDRTNFALLGLGVTV
jgi:hypothetical protein